MPSSPNSSRVLSNLQHSYPPVPKIHNIPDEDPIELSERDDLSTALIVDPALGFDTHKMNIINPLRRFNQNKLKSILERFRISKNYEEAYKEYANTGYLDAFYYPEEVRRLRDHIYSFLKMFDPRCGFEIQPCNRYAGDKNGGAKIISTRSWERGEKIDGLVAFSSEMSPAEAKELLKPGENDFSIMISTQKKDSQLLFLGPAAFVNHDCRSNCVFEATEQGSKTAFFKVIRPIEPDDEITTNYGKNYFGELNCHCACESCERTGMGVYSKEFPDIRKYNLRYTHNRIQRIKRFKSE